MVAHLAASAPKIVHAFGTMLRAEARGLSVITIVGSNFAIGDFAPKVLIRPGAVGGGHRNGIKRRLRSQRFGLGGKVEQTKIARLPQRST